jgi:hypothetical protein
MTEQSEQSIPPNSHRAPDELTQSLTIQGALNVADKTRLDTGNTQNIALKVLAHEYRVLRKKFDGMCDLAMARAEQ